MFVFLLLGLALLLVLYFVLDCKTNKTISNYHLKAGTTILILGDSHSQYAFDDKLLQGSINLSQFSESTFFTYYKLRYLLMNNPGIKQVYLGFGYHSISSYYDDYTFGEFSKDISSRYFFLLPMKERLNLLEKSKWGIPMLLKNSMVNGLKLFSSEVTNPPYLGKYMNGFKACQAVRSSMEKRIQQQFYLNTKLKGFSELNIGYFHRIVELCKQYQVQLTVLNTPLHPYYKSKIPKVFIKRYNQVMFENKVNVINFDKLELADSCFIPDGDHISEKGVRLATEILKY